jgi:DNA-binding protein YbaB
MKGVGVVMDDETIDFDAILAEIDRKEADLEAAERRLAAVTATARSADGLAEVTVSATGAVTSIHLSPEAFRRSTPEYLGKSVAEAAQQATRQVRQSTRAAVTPIAAVGKELAEAVEEPQAPRAHTQSAQIDGIGAEASSTDRSARVGVDAMGIVAVVHIAPNAYRGGTTTRLAAAITEAAELAARQMFETRMGTIESELGVEDMPNMDEFFPTPAAPEPVAPVQAPPPAYTPPPPAAPTAPAVSNWNPISGRPGERVVGPSDWDDEMGDYGGGQQRSWLR